MRYKSGLLAICALLMPYTLFASGLAATQTITSDWNTGFCVNITLKNTDATPATWSSFFFNLSNATISSSWGGYFSNTSGLFTVKPVSWNKQIAALGSVDIGYCANGSGRPTGLSLSDGSIITPPPPPIVPMRPSTVILTKDGLSLTSTVTSDWNTGYCRSVILKNIGNIPITNWGFSLDLATNINPWSAVAKKVGNTYTLSPASWNAKLGQAEAGFCVQGTESDTNWKITLVTNDTTLPPPPPTPVNGSCGADNGKTLSVAPTALCSTGTPSALIGTGPWTWTCLEKNNGTNASCQANKNTIIPPPPPPITGSSIVIGYYPSWARYSYTYDKIDYSQFDYINHAFAFPTLSGNLKIDADFLYPELVAATHANNKKILLTLGDLWGSTIFPTVLGNAKTRSVFLQSIKKMVTDNGYDGVDVDWEVPNSSKEGLLLVEFIKDLKILLPEKTVIVTISIAPHDMDVQALVAAADYVNLMAYDLEGWDGISGYNAPLYHNSKMRVDMSIDYLFRTHFANLNIDKKKLILGFPLYGRKFMTTTPYAPGYQATEVEYKDLPKNCTRIWDSESQVPYLSCNGFYISYDDEQSYAAKKLFANTNGLGGMFFWALGQDAGVITAKVKNIQ